MNVVVVDPGEVLAELLRRPLEPLGHAVHAVADIARLGAELERHAPRAVVLPRRLPDADLAAVIATIRRTDDATEIAAIVVGLEPGDRALARAAGADGFLQVPFADAEVLSVLGASTRKKLLVLLADDSPLIHRHTVPILEDADLEVVTALDGITALELARARRPDLVISDIEMPGLDGYALCHALKHDPALAHVPVLIASSLGEAADLERGFDAGADDYVVKPVVPEDLMTRVSHLLSGSLPASRERILVVDDSPAQRHYVADCLARQGFEVATAEDGRVALAKAQALFPALVISDYEMPGMTGFELVHALKRAPETRNIPVIMLTARDTKRDMAQMRAAGASAYLVKPFAQDKCVALVERTLAERRLLDYKLASSVYISDGARRAAEQRASSRDLGAVRADQREMSVLFSDIVGFTNMSSKLAPSEVIALLNHYFDLLCPEVVAEHGDIDKFIGDAIMAVFDVGPGWDPPAERAVRAALAMQAQMPAFNAGRAEPMRTRIGINTGPLVRGDLGSRFVRRDYTVIGDTVNKANRYEANCPPGGVLISASTYAQLRDIVEVEALDGLKLKGIAEPVTGYVVKAIAPRAAEPDPTAGGSR